MDGSYPAETKTLEKEEANPDPDLEHSNCIAFRSVKIRYFPGKRHYHSLLS